MNPFKKIKFFSDVIDFLRKIEDILPIEELKNLINWEYLDALTKKTDNVIDDKIVSIIRYLLGA